MSVPCQSKGQDTKTRILTMAETLFAQNGFRQTTISQLARRAGVNQAAVNYHFGSKAGLIEQVLERRLQPIHHVRMQRLEAIRAATTQRGATPDVAEVLRAFIEPAFCLTQGADGGRNFLLIASRVMVEPDEAIRALFLRHFRPAFILLFTLMQKSLGGMPENELLWRMHFVVGALGHAMRVHGTVMPPADLFPADRSVDTMVRSLVAFLTAGMGASFGESAPADLPAEPS
ncbi:putative Transcriptional regulator, TetR family [Desulfosarcina cetonica]|uniref:TetR/AcrR family transcriptional regulator n=1 Tax=Desulfosarcina cetonica TaxID=90730 RepID=UPI0006D1CD10|nr:TetR/AcrR family transcriptional regulator [Desulfosarcina cetonica]VTR65501.1 putative Transcriptional regulator, TetR family [Desulfosarcina cetonica]